MCPERDILTERNDLPHLVGKRSELPIELA